PYGPRRALARPACPTRRPSDLFQTSRIQSIGDPLYGDLRRVAVVTDARLALIPLGALWIPEVGGAGRIHVAAALIDTMGGAVLRSEEHTSELQSRENLVCRLLL